MTPSPLAQQFLENLSTAILNPLSRILFGVATVLFLWGVIEFMQNSDNPAKRTQGISHIIWGIVGMTIMVSVWGILNFVIGTISS